MDNRVENISKESLTPIVRQALNQPTVVPTTWEITPMHGGWGSAVGGTALLLGVLSLSARDSGAYEKAKRLAEESLALRRAIRDPWGTAYALHVLGWIAVARGEQEKAERCFRESVSIHLETGHRGTDLVGGLFALSSTLIWVGKYREAHSLAREALVQCADTGNRNQLPWASRNLGEAKLHLGHYADAQAQLQKGLDLLEETGETRFLVAALASLGCAALALGERPDVCGYLEQRINLTGEVGSWRMNFELTVGLTILAYAAQRTGKPDQARQYLAQALRPAIKTRNSYP